MTIFLKVTFKVEEVKKLKECFPFICFLLIFEEESVLESKERNIYIYTHTRDNTMRDKMINEDFALR